jgi:endonuclease/exonuclease/phosphatase family metal-dependent hydrolase
MKQLILAIGILALTLPGCDKTPPQQKVEAMKVMSFNIRYANDGDSLDAWKNRKEAVAKMLQAEQPALLGLQEVLHEQLTYLTDTLTDYRHIGVGRDDGEQAGEYSPILYDTRRVKAVKSGYFWLGEDPSQPKKGWDAVCVRIATWGVFQDIKTGRELIMINTHFDHVGKLARENSAKQMLDSIKRLASGLPAVVMGDFNCTTDDPSLAPLVKNLKNSHGFSPEFSEKNVPYTFTGFKDRPADRSLIDHIFVRDAQVTQYKIINEHYGVPHLSDHLPVVSVISF